ncbi:dihydropteroate synthase [bacterium]|nr:dihydropteroate synthase [bacterium]
MFDPALFLANTPTRIMAAINVSPESFFGGSVARDEQALADAVRRAEEAGAAMIDIGAMSTAPYKEARIDEAEEVERMRWAVQVACGATRLPISADTQRLGVARAALDAGATIINDVSALQIAPAIGALCAERSAGLILMASEHGPIAERDQSPGAVVGRLLSEAIARAVAAGVPRTHLLIDPGFGFFRHRSRAWYEWDLELLRHLDEWQQEGVGSLIGVSRKSLFKELLGREKPADRLAGSLAVAAYAVWHGVEWLRVHDVAETRDVVRMMELLR